MDDVHMGKSPWAADRSPASAGPAALTTLLTAGLDLVGAAP
ncbi:hypothetical protein [Streptomyces sp. NPDC002788]